MKPVAIFSSVLVFLLTSCNALMGPDAYEKKDVIYDTSVFNSETVEITVTPKSFTPLLETVESKTFTITFSADPGDVTITVSNSNPESISISPSSINVTSANYTTPVVVTLTATDDANFVSESIEIDVNANGEKVETVYVETIDNDKKLFHYQIVGAMNTMDTVGGISAIDNSCQADDRAISTGGVYKGMVADGTNRRAAITANAAGGAGEQLDWVFKPNYSYYREGDEAKVFTADANGVLDFGKYLIENSFSTAGQTLLTGMNQNWTTQTGTCDGFTSQTAGSTFTASNSGLDGTAIYNPSTSFGCDGKNIQIICVQQ